MNVAVTRARKHCCVICDVDCVSSDKFVKGLCEFIEERGEVRNVKGGDDGFSLVREAESSSSTGNAKFDPNAIMRKVERQEKKVQVAKSTKKNSKPKTKPKPTTESKNPNPESERDDDVVEKGFEKEVSIIY